MALMLMCWLRCLLPPSGGLAMTLVLADPASIALGWQEVGPVMLGAGTLLLSALAYNNLTRTRYPKGPAEVPVMVQPHAREVDAKITAVDLEQALAQMEQFFDVTPSELEELIHIAEDHARRRSIGQVLASRVTQSSQDSVLAEVRNHIGHLTLNRPAGLNAITLDMVRSLSAHLRAWAEDAQVHAVVLRGAGEKAFCAGGDIRSLYDSFKGGDTLHEDFFVEEYALDLAIHHYRKPVLALMDGFVLGGGMGLVQGADLRVVTERSRL
eukprot:gene24864-24969_t